jgi:hypothetical protein
MKRIVSLLLVAALAAAGCDTLPRLWEQPHPVPAKEANQKPPARQAITADQVSDANARAAADALGREIQQDAQAETLTPRTK